MNEIATAQPIIFILQNSALALFCAGLILTMRKNTRSIVPALMIHGGAILLMVARWTTDKAASLPVAILVTMIAITLVRVILQREPLWPFASGAILLEATEVVSAMTLASSDGVFSTAALLRVAVFASLFPLLTLIAVRAKYRIHQILCMECGADMMLFTAPLILGSILLLRGRVLQIPGPLFTGISINDMAWLATLLTLSANQSLLGSWDREHAWQNAMLVILVCIGFAALGAFAKGVSLVIAALIAMVRRGHSVRRTVCLAIVSIVAAVLVSTLDHRTFPEWLSEWTGESNGFGRPLTFAQMVSDLQVWGCGIGAYGIKLMNVPLSHCFGMSRTLTCFGVPGLACLLVVALSVVKMSVDSILRCDLIGISIPFLGVVWSVELLIHIFVALGIMPSIQGWHSIDFTGPLFAASGMPFAGIGLLPEAPLMAAPAIALSFACDSFAGLLVQNNQITSKAHFGIIPYDPSDPNDKYYYDDDLDDETIAYIETLMAQDEEDDRKE